jgi:uncharacterized protein
VFLRNPVPSVVTKLSLKLPSRVTLPYKRITITPMISQDLLDIMVCPMCKQPVALNPDGQSLKCSVCRRVYPIQDDIPIMLVDAAKIDAA